MDFKFFDSCSQFGLSRMLKSKKSEDFCDAFRQIFYSHGAPVILHTDNGEEFKNIKMKNLSEVFGVFYKNGSARAPWMQGLFERLNHSIKRWISATSEGNWSFGVYLNILQKIVYNYNMSVHSTPKKTLLPLSRCQRFSFNEYTYIQD